MDSVSLLFRRIGKISGGRDSARRQRHAAVHGRYLHRSDPAGGTGLRPFCLDRFASGNMGLLARRLDHRHGTVPFLLPQTV